MRLLVLLTCIAAATIVLPDAAPHSVGWVGLSEGVTLDQGTIPTQTIPPAFVWDDGTRKDKKSYKFLPHAEATQDSDRTACAALCEGQRISDNKNCAHLIQDLPQDICAEVQYKTGEIQRHKREIRSQRDEIQRQHEEIQNQTDIIEGQQAEIQNQTDIIEGQQAEIQNLKDDVHTLTIATFGIQKLKDEVHTLKVVAIVLTVGVLVAAMVAGFTSFWCLYYRKMALTTEEQERGLNGGSTDNRSLNTETRQHEITYKNPGHDLST